VKLSDREQNSALKGESRLSGAEDELIAERTAELTKANQALLAEVDARRRAEEELSRSEALLRSIVDNSTSIIHLKDNDGRYIFVNCQFEAVFRIDEVDVRGKSDFERRATYLSFEQISNVRFCGWALRNLLDLR
jgi:PAS domain-containing protein